MSNDNVMYDRYDEVAALFQGVAHEINNPLTVIRTNADNVRKLIERLDGEADSADNLSEEEVRQRLRQALNGIDEAAGRITTVVENFRDFAGRENREKVPLSLRDVVESSVDMASYQANRIDSIEVDVPEDVRVLGNKIQLQQALINLITNAVHAIEERMENEQEPESGRVLIEMERGPDKVDLLIHDNGTDVPEEIRGKIFGPYFTTKRQGKGFGVGLSKALGIAREHDGEVFYRNTDRTGATFVLRLPEAEGTEEDTE